MEHQEMVSEIFTTGLMAIENEKKARKAYLCAKEEKFLRMEDKNRIAQKVKDMILARVGGWKNLGSSEGARQAELDRQLMLSYDNYLPALDSYHDAAANESAAEVEVTICEAVRKMHQAALYALGGVRG